MSTTRVLIIGSFLGIVTVVLLNLYISQLQAKQVSVAVIRLKPEVSLAKGDLVKPEMVRTVKLPQQFDHLVDMALPANGEAAVWIKGRPVTRDVASGGLLLYSHFEDVPEERFAARITEKMRALTIPVDATSAVGYFVEPGSRVDILATLSNIEVGSLKLPRLPRGASPPAGSSLPTSIPTATEKVATKTLLQNVRVLAVGTATTRGAYVGNSSGGFATVTVEVTPYQAEKLVFALEHARRGLTLVLRNAADDGVEPLPAVSWAALENIR